MRLLQKDYTDLRNQFDKTKKEKFEAEQAMHAAKTKLSQTEATLSQCQMELSQCEMELNEVKLDLEKEREQRT